MGLRESDLVMKLFRPKQSLFWKNGIEANQPIPVNCIFGSSESEKDYVDVAEFQSLQTLKDIAGELLNSTIQA